MSWVGVRRVVTVLLLTAGLAGSCSTNQANQPVVRDSTLLPAPLAVPVGALDDVAAALAARVAAGGTDRLPALLTAVRLAGIAVRDIDGRVAQPAAQPAQGLALLSGEVLALGRGGEGSNPVNLQVLADTIAGATPPALGLPRAPLAGMLLEGLAAQASSSATHRFWARFIVELGKHSSRPYDLLASPDPATVDLDGVQSVLIVLRLAGDLAGAAGWTPKPKAARPAFPVVDAYADGKQPCSLGEPATSIMDVSALASSFGFQKLVKAVLDKFGAPSTPVNYEAAAGGIGAALAIAKFVATSLLLEKHIELINGSPLKRTKTTRAGEQRELEAMLEFKTGRGQYANCFRILSNGLAGQDFNLPENGPLENAEVTWHVGSGPVLFTGPSGSNPVVMKSGSDGKVRAGIEGKPQKKQVPDGAKPVTVKANVYITIAVKTANFFKDLMDILTTASGGPIAAPINMIVNLMDRWGTRAEELNFDVTDWPHDYIVDYTTAGVRFLGKVCDGPDGAWVIAAYGKIDQAGFVTTATGDFTVNLDPPANLGGDARGTWNGQMGVNGVDASGLVKIDISVSGSGAAAFRASGDGGTLAFQKGTASGSVTGGGPGITIEDIVFAQTNEVDFPVKVGSFCD